MCARARVCVCVCVCVCVFVCVCVCVCVCVLFAVSINDSITHRHTLIVLQCAYTATSPRERPPKPSPFSLSHTHSHTRTRTLKTYSLAKIFKILDKKYLHLLSNAQRFLMFSPFSPYSSNPPWLSTYETKEINCEHKASVPCFSAFWQAKHLASCSPSRLCFASPNDLSICRTLRLRSRGSISRTEKNTLSTYFKELSLSVVNASTSNDMFLTNASY